MTNETSCRKWEMCRPPGERGRWRAPQATINRRNMITISKVAWEMLNSAPWLTIFYDRDARVIGLQPSSANTWGTVPFIVPSRGTGRRVDAYALKIQFGLSIPRRCGSSRVSTRTAS